MSRLVLTAFGEPAEVLALQSDPDLPLGPDDLLVAVEAATINPTDSLLAKGRYGVRPELPYAMGSEGVGRVLDAGSDAHTALVGRRVILLPGTGLGARADRITVPAANVVVAAENADAAQLAMVPINPATAHILLNRYVTLEPGDWIGQDLGNSAVGQYVVRLAKLAGVKTVSTVRRESAAEQLRAIGADIVPVEGDKLSHRVREALGHNIYRELRHVGFWLVNWVRQAPRAAIERTYRELADLVANGELSAHVEATYPLAEYRAALAHADRAGRTGKVLFRMG